MGVEIKTSLPNRIRALKAKHPYLDASDIAALAGLRKDAVRSVLSRRDMGQGARKLDGKGRLKVARDGE